MLANWLILVLGAVFLHSVSTEISSRIIGGEPARAAQFPYIAAIWTYTDNGRYFCVGALVTNQWILTAANCLDGGQQFQIQLGSHTLNGTDPNRVSVTANTSVIHPDYDYMTLENNIGLIQLSEPVLLSDYIGTIFLPSTDLQHDASAVSVGWGQTDDYTPGPVDHLNFVSVTTLTDEACKSTYGSQIGPNMFCVEGSYNQGTCIGDNGGPLVRYVLNERHAEHVGVSSFLSFNGCESTDPSGFTKTWGYVDWIRQTIGTK